MSEKKGLFGGLFGGKKTGCCCNIEIVEEQEDTPCCDCGGTCNSDDNVEKQDDDNGVMNIKILGPGCKNCVTLAENTKAALEQMGMEANIDKVTDMAAIAGYGIMSTPGLVVNDKVVSFGKVLKPNDIVKIIEKIK